ncbi:MAG TPA: O-antigen ligase family protein [Armatimonadota bacterium]|nr:O-antigen ligase family protein [Armatimonadota bacterium]
MKQESVLAGMARPAWISLLCLCAVLAPWLGGQVEGVGPLVCRALAFTAALGFLADRRLDWSLPAPVRWLAWFFGWSALTLVVSNHLHASIVFLADVLSWMVLAVMASFAVRTDRFRNALLGAVLAGLVTHAAFGVWHWHASDPGWREFGSFTTPNLLASWLVTVLPLAIFGLTLGRGVSPVWVRVMFALGTLGGTAALFATGSKGAILALLIGLVVCVSVLGIRKVFTTGALAVLVLAAVAWTISGSTLTGRISSAQTGQAHSSEFRKLTWQATGKMIAAHPVLGTGAGTFGTSFGPYATAGWTAAAHNAFLQTAAETGIPGLILFVIALGSAFIGMFRAVRSGVSDVLPMAAVGGLTASAAHNMVDFGWTVWGPAAILWLIVGMAWKHDDGRGASRRVVLTVTAGLTAALIAVLLAANAQSMDDDARQAQTPEDALRLIKTAAYLDPLNADIAVHEGDVLRTMGNPEKAVAAYYRAAGLSKGDGAIWRRLGETLLEIGRKDEAQSALEAGLKASPFNYRILSALARLDISEGRQDDANGRFRDIIALWEGPVGRFSATPEVVPMEPVTAYRTLALWHESRGEMVEARRMWQGALNTSMKYLRNKAANEMMWKAVHRDDPVEEAEVRAIVEEARKRGLSPQ